MYLYFIKDNIINIIKQHKNGELKMRIYTQLIVVFHIAPSKVSPAHQGTTWLLGQGREKVDFSKA